MANVFILACLFVIYPALTFAKSGGDHLYMPSSAEVVSPEVVKVLSGVLHGGGGYSIGDPNCHDLSFTLQRDALEARVNGNSFYILRGELSIGGKNYLESSCNRVKSDREISIECISRSEESMNTMDESDSLVFYMHYADGEGKYETIVRNCPTIGEISP